MRRCVPWLLGMLLLSGGCRGVDPPGLWYGPQTPPAVQRQQAQQVDPYPATDTGPEVVGGRPPGYENPPAEIRRVQPNRWFRFPGS